jgi:hypothetical protein
MPIPPNMIAQIIRVTLGNIARSTVIKNLFSKVGSTAASTTAGTTGNILKKLIPSRMLVTYFTRSLALLEGIAKTAVKLAKFGFTGYAGYALRKTQEVVSKLEANIGLKELGIETRISPIMEPFGATKYWESIRKQIFAANRDLLIAGNATQAISRNIVEAGTASLKYGFGEKEIVEGYKQLMEKYERNILFSPEEFQMLGMINQSYGETFSEILATSKLYGRSVFDTYKSMERVNRVADKFGVNSAKVMKDINTNIKLIDKFQFKNGIDGLAKMVIQAKRFNLEISSVVGLMDSLVDPEAAFETAARLQSLGGPLGAIADPLKLIQEARYDPEAFTKTFTQAMKGFGTLNRQTGEIEIKGGEADLIREYSKVLNMSVQELQSMIKVGRKEELLSRNLPSWAIGMQQRDEVIANLAGKLNFKGGQPFIEIGGAKVLASEITKAQYDALSTIRPDSTDSIASNITDNMTQLQNMENAMKELERLMAGNNLDNQVLIKESQALNLIAGGIRSSMEDGFFRTFSNSVQVLASETLDNMLPVIMKATEGKFMGALGKTYGNLLDIKEIGTIAKTGYETGASLLGDRKFDEKTGVNYGTVNTNLGVGSNIGQGNQIRQRDNFSTMYTTPIQPSLQSTITTMSAPSTSTSGIGLSRDGIGSNSFNFPQYSAVSSLPPSNRNLASAPAAQTPSVTTGSSSATMDYLKNNITIGGNVSVKMEAGDKPFVVSVMVDGKKTTDFDLTSNKEFMKAIEDRSLMAIERSLKSTNHNMKDDVPSKPLEPLRPKY